MSTSFIDLSLKSLQLSALGSINSINEPTKAYPLLAHIKGMHSDRLMKSFAIVALLEIVFPLESLSLPLNLLVACGCWFLFAFFYFFLVDVRLLVLRVLGPPPVFPFVFVLAFVLLFCSAILRIFRAS